MQRQAFDVFADYHQFYLWDRGMNAEAPTDYTDEDVRRRIKTGPHVAGNGVQFYTGSMFPADYKNRLFLAQRGSWNRTQKSGFRVMTATLTQGGAPKYEVFAEGWLQGNEIWGRPVYTQQMKDGSLLISDDYAGAIYRVAYQR